MSLLDYVVSNTPLPAKTASTHSLNSVNAVVPRTVALGLPKKPLYTERTHSVGAETESESESGSRKGSFNYIASSLAPVHQSPDAFLASFSAPLLRPVAAQPHIVRITLASQLGRLLDYYYTDPANALLESCRVFPYLHGLNSINQRVFFGPSFSEDDDLLCYSRKDVEKDPVVPDFPEEHFLLMTVCTSEEAPKMANSVALADLLTPKKDGVHEPFSRVNRLGEDTDLNNRNFRSQIRLSAPFCHFLVYSNDMDYEKNLKAAVTIAGLVDPRAPKFVFVVDMNVPDWQMVDACYLEKEEDPVYQPINTINNKPFDCKLLKFEQNLIWKANSLKWVYLNVCLGNLIDFNYLTTPLLTTGKPPKHNFKLYINCHENAQFPDLDLLNKLWATLKEDPKKVLQMEAIYIEFPSSGTLHCLKITFEETLSYLNVLKLIHFYLVHQKVDVLIFSFDGFTGLSLLTISVGNMLEGPFTEDVICDVLTKKPNKLYFFKNDLVFLKKFEKFVQWLKRYHLEQDFRLVSDLDFELVNGVYTEVIDDCKRNGGIQKYDWFDLERDNNFPLRIYNNLYLGSLNHASSLSILSLLEITKIISMGEKPAWFDMLNVVFEHDISSVPVSKKTVLRPIYSFNDGTAKIYEIKLKDARVHEKLKRKLPNLKTVIYVHNIRDDGKDSLLPLLIGCPPKISKKLLIDPKSRRYKTLIHCKIGVSRSASLVIASAMKYYGMDILNAYMFVRIRRFNIIIQPNLRVFYELFTYDEHLRSKLDAGHRGRKYCWWTLCHEIFKLNSHYIA